MNVFYVNVLLFALPSLVYANLSVTKLEKIGMKPTKTALNCKTISCPAIEDPICVKIKSKNEKFKNVTTYIQMVNKCELNYMKCHQHMEAAIVQMKFCDHIAKPDKSGAKRAKRTAKYEPNVDEHSQANNTAKVKSKSSDLRKGLVKNIKLAKAKTSKPERDGKKSRRRSIKAAKHKVDGNRDDEGKKRLNYKGTAPNNDIQTGSNIDVNMKDGDETFKNKEARNDKSADNSDYSEPQFGSPESHTDTEEIKEDTNIRPLTIDQDGAETHSDTDNKGELKGDGNHDQTDSDDIDEDVSEGVVLEGEPPRKPDAGLSASGEGENGASHEKDVGNHHQASEGERSAAPQESVEDRWKPSNCPTKCPARVVMVCGLCKHGVFKTFLSVCHMRMYACNHEEEQMNLVTRFPCVASAPLISNAKGMNMTPTGIEDDPYATDKVLKFIEERSKGLIGKLSRLKLNATDCELQNTPCDRAFGDWV